MAFIRYLFPVLLLVNITSVWSTKTLVLLEHFSLRETHHEFFQTLEKQGLHLTFKLADDPDLTLLNYGEYLFRNLIIFAPSTEEFGGSLTVQALTDFIDSGGNIMVGLDSHHSGSAVMELANECGFDIDKSSLVIDHWNYDVNDDGNHTLLVIDPRNLINATPLVGSRIILPILYRGVGISSDVESLSIIKILSAVPPAYIQNFYGTKGLHALDKNILLVAGIQARNNARIVFSGSIDLFSDLFFHSGAKRAHGDKTVVKSGNREFVTQLSQWVFKNSGMLRIQNVAHYRKNESSAPATYSVRDTVVYSIEVAVLRNGEWAVYEADDLQLEVVRIDPFVRTALKRQGNKYVAEVKLPDIWGVFQFKVDYRRLGYSHLFSTTQIAVRPLEHTQYERFIPVAYPYYLSAFSMMFGVFVFSMIFLYGSGTSKQKKD